VLVALDAAKYCEEPACRRAGQCMTPKVRCFWEHLDLMQRVVFPAMRRKLKGMRRAATARRRSGKTEGPTVARAPSPLRSRLLATSTDRCAMSATADMRWEKVSLRSNDG